MKSLLINLVYKYQNNKKENHVCTCIFYPSCSNYAIMALKKYNVFRSLYLILKRIYRCDSSRNIGGIDFP